MSGTLIIDGKEFVSATIAGKQFGYTKDYLLLRIKQGYIEGQKIGNKWYVHLPSAENYFRTAEIERETRKRVMSMERKEEIKRYASSRKSVTHHAAVIETLVIVVIGLSLGATGYLGTTTMNQASVHDGFFSSLARSLYLLITPPPETRSIHVNTPIETSAEDESAISARVGTTSYTSLIVAPEELFTTTTVEEIQDSFSDPVSVSVDPENPDTGIITPIFKDGKQRNEYRFLMVPVKTE